MSYASEKAINLARGRGTWDDMQRAESLDELRETVSGLQRGECIASDSLLALAEQIEPSEPDDVDAWAERLGRELAEVEACRHPNHTVTGYDSPVLVYECSDCGWSDVAPNSLWPDLNGGDDADG